MIMITCSDHDNDKDYQLDTLCLNKTIMIMMIVITKMAVITRDDYNQLIAVF